MHFLLFYFLFLKFNPISSFHLEATSICANKNATSEPVIKYCDSENGYMIRGCCRSFDNLTFIAVDLTDLNLTQVPDFTQYANFNLSVIDLRLNPQLVSSYDYDFLTLTYLDELILPENFSCPGGQNVWETVNTTINPIGNLCMHQKDFCLNLTDKCSAEGSYCSVNGPDHFLCLCKNNYHGYKCLRNGQFPTGVFFGSSTTAAVIISAFLYWTQRRHVKTK